MTRSESEILSKIGKRFDVEDLAKEICKAEFDGTIMELNVMTGDVTNLTLSPKLNLTLSKARMLKT